MQWNIFRRLIETLIACVLIIMSSGQEVAHAQQTDQNGDLLTAYADEIVLRMTTINNWAESTRSMVESLVLSIGDLSHPEVRSFAAEALDMSWYDLDDSGVIPFLQNHADTLKQWNNDPQAVDRFTQGMNVWREKADQLEALYVGCLFPHDQM